MHQARLARVALTTSPCDKRRFKALSSTPHLRLYHCPAFRFLQTLFLLLQSHTSSPDLLSPALPGGVSRSYLRAMESSLRNLLHSNEPSYESASLHSGHVPPQLDRNGSFIGTLEAETALSESRKRPASRIKSSYPRRRAIQACQKCRVRRTKCNNARPSCSSCLSIGADCTYSEGDHSTYVE